MEKNTNKPGKAKKILKAIGIILLIVVLLLGGFIGYLSITEFKPADRESLTAEGEAAKTIAVGDSLHVMSWNVGYGALGDNADFFMDGGTMVQSADEARIGENMSAITEAILNAEPDVLFLQETDRDSKRSEYVDEYALVRDKLNGTAMGAGYQAVFANNFKVAFLPYPVPPIGKVDSGVATYSQYAIDSAERVQLPVPFSWPVSMINLKRCLLVSRVKIENSDKELVLVNLHLEAYDDGEGKLAQTKMLAELLDAEAAKGNYVIAGGDFNQIFSSANGEKYPVYEGNWVAPEMDVTQFTGDWQFLMDEEIPSCRLLNKPYKDADKATFQYYMIDGFIVSGNLEVSAFRAIDLGFEASDHNPLVMTVTLK
ncbi:MAG: endonuclease/exonuclease/phosphatase family protein [Clostridia bacterium]|nr:endonuclease/exonuclease/phosphatase family protein [Clostridia bacterium]